MTYLYIKWHPIDPSNRFDGRGLFYLGKITLDPISYPGSGKYWKSHVRKYGKESVETLWYCLFTNQEELTKFALACSELWDIVKSDLWANLAPENGIDGTIKGSKFGPQTAEQIARKSTALKGRLAWNKDKKIGSYSAERRANMNKKIRSPEHIANSLGKIPWNKGKKLGPRKKLVDK